MIECTKCLKWAHFECAGLSTTRVKKIGDDDWFCEVCILANAQDVPAAKEPAVDVHEEALPEPTIDHLMNLLTASYSAREDSLKRHAEHSQQLLVRLAELEDKLNVLPAANAIPKEPGTKPKTVTPQESAKANLKRQLSDQMLRLKRLEECEANLLEVNSKPIVIEDYVSGRSSPIEMAVSQAYDSTLPLSSLEKLSAIMTRPLIGTLRPFSGEIREWGTFKRQYEQTTKQGGFTDLDNKGRLEAALKGPARELVRHLLLTSERGSEIMELLGERYGRPDVLVIEYLQPWLDHATIEKAIDPKLYTFAIEGKTAIANIRTMNAPELLKQEYVLVQLTKKLEKTSYYQHWMDRKVSAENPLDLEDFANFLMEKAKKLPTSVLQSASEMPPVNKTPKGRAVMTHQVQTSSPQSSKRFQCFSCQGQHGLWKCDAFLNMSIDEKWNFVKGKGICSCCLRSSQHIQANCPDKRQCYVTDCQKFHNKLLHPTRAKQNGDASPREQPVCADANVFVPQPRVNNHHGLHRDTFFKVVPVSIYNKNMQPVETFALLDGGSGASLIDKEFFKSLELGGREEKLLLQWTKGITREENSTCSSIKISAASSKKQFEMQGVYTVEDLNLPEQSRDVQKLQKRFNYLRGLPICDLNQAKPTILIGLEHAKLLVETRTRQGGDNDPLVSKTPLGWIIWGKPSASVGVRSLLHKGKTSTFSSFHVARNEEDELHNLVGKYFMTENFGVTPGSQALVGRKEKRAIDLMTSQMKFHDGRYEMPLLWENDEVQLPDSYAMTLKRLKMLENKLLKDPKLREWMDNYVRELLQKGYARVATEEDLNTPWPRIWYAPLFVVINPNKEVPKPRVVADVAAQVNGVSLNSKLLKGPDYMVPLLAGLFQFRVNAVAVNADVKEMFPQVVIKKEDQQCQRFLYRNCDQSKEPTIFLMQRMLFGPVCSPSTAQFVKNSHANKFRKKYPEAVRALTETTYVDDYFNSHETVEQAFQVLSQAIEICASMGFELVGAQSNKMDLMSKLPAKNVKQSLVNLDPTEMDSYQTKVLGMFWTAILDFFTFKVSMDSEKTTTTKREILRIIMKTWDPLGLIAHFLVQGKMILQDVWREGLGWDQLVPENILLKWSQFAEKLRDVENLQIPRHYASDISHCSTISLVVFVDASEEAFAAVAYFRFEAPDGRTHVAQVMAKAKVAPIKPLTIPKLELQGSVLGKRLIVTIRELHPTMNIQRVFILCDSECVLHWIWSDHYKFTPFVAARVSEILDATKPDEWFHVPTEFNVADDATRFREVDVGNHNSRWYQGPDFLRQPVDLWPISQQKKKAISEITAKTTLLFTVGGRERVIFHEDFGLLNNIKAHFKAMWTSLTSVISFMSRFVNKLRKKSQELANFPTVEEVSKAEEVVFRKIQQDAYTDELQSLIKKPDGSGLSASSRIIQLNPFLDESGVLRMRSRAQAANASYASRNPVILPSKHEFVDLFIQHVHRTNKHMSEETTIADIREKVWIVNIRSALRRVVSQCQLCKIKKASPKFPVMGQLIVERLDFGERPFTNVGMDCFGPLKVRQGRSTIKRYGLIFTCLTYRAIHLELVVDLSLDQIMIAIRSLFARRGRAKKFRSDNGKNFVGASRQLIKDGKDIEAQFGRAVAEAFEVDWKFIPAYAPWMGGAWERLIQTVKRSVEFTLRGEIPREDVLRGALIEAEYEMNRRPLTHTPIDHEDSKPLTPNTVLFGEDIDSTSPANVHAGQISRLAYRRVQHLCNKYMQRWLTEYLPEITRRSKWHKNSKPVKVDDIVIVIEPNQSRQEWRRGRVVQVYPGPDGIVRTADIMLPDRSLKLRRAVGRLAVLDVEGGIRTPSHTGGGMSSSNNN